MNFEINRFLSEKKKVMIKTKHHENKRAFKMKRKAFFIIFKGLSMKQIRYFCLEGESPTLNWQFWIFGTNLPQKGISSQKQKK